MKLYVFICCSSRQRQNQPHTLLTSDQTINALSTQRLLLDQNQTVRTYKCQSHRSSTKNFSTPTKGLTATDSGKTRVDHNIREESHHSTPISASNPHYSDIHRNQQVKVPRLMRANIIQRHADFFSSLLPELPDKSHVSISCLESLPQDLWSGSSFAFTRIKGEKKMYIPLIATLNAILDFTPEGSPSSSNTVNSTLSESPAHPAYEFVRTDQDFANRDKLERAKEEPYFNRRTDLAMVPKTSRDESGSWYDVALSIEVKDNLKAHAMPQADGQAEAILKNSPTKRFLFSFIICASSLEVCLWDRAGVITAEPIDVNNNPHRFIEIVRRFGSMSTKDLGFDQTTIEMPPNIKLPSYKSQIRSPIVSIQGKTYLRTETVACSSSCFGRSTRCFKARRLVKKGGRRRWSQKTYLLKYFWNDVNRKPDEGEIYDKIKEAGVEVGVAVYVGFERFSTLSDIRKGLTLWNGDQNDATKGDSQIVDQEVFGDRQLCVLVLATVGRSISKARTVHELISATITAVKGHKEIYKKARILHRDISTNNIRIRDAPEEFDDCDEDDGDKEDGDKEDGDKEDDEEDDGMSESALLDTGFLIDFDLSLIDDGSEAAHSERLARTGTFSFMAWQIMRVPASGGSQQSGGQDVTGSPDSAGSSSDDAMIRDLHDQRARNTQEDGVSRSPLHDFRHDLQSFFWVLLYICAGSPTFTQDLLDYSHPSSGIMQLFAQQTEPGARTTKEAFLRCYDCKVWVTPDFKPMRWPLEKLRTLFHPKQVAWDALTHDAFISILEEALEVPVVQERRPIKKPIFSPVYQSNLYQRFPPLIEPNLAGSRSQNEASAEGSISSTLDKCANVARRPMTRSQTSKRPRSIRAAAPSSTASAPHQQQPSSSSKKRTATSSFPARDSKRARKE